MIIRSKIVTLVSYVVLGGLLTFASWAAWAAQPSTSQTQTVELSKLNQLIEKMRATLSVDHGKQVQLNQQLHSTEKNLGQISARVTKLNQHIARETQHLQALQIQSEDFEQALQRQQFILAEQLRKTYVLSRHIQPAMLLGQDPAAISRMLNYYRYINQARSLEMENINKALQDLLLNQKQLKMQKHNLQQMLARHQEQHDALKNTQQNKQQLLIQVNSTIETHQQKLVSLVANKAALEKLIKQLQANRQKFLSTSTPFAKLQGKLPWPIAGKITKRYGNQMGNSGLKYNGVLLVAPLQQPIKAIYPGRVIFANWLQGFGLILIIDHGKGYMTLYGRNKDLFKKTGDIVRAGDTIASLGNNNGHEQAGLYFEIRHNGHPSNPETWCR